MCYNIQVRYDPLYSRVYTLGYVRFAFQEKKEIMGKEGKKEKKDHGPPARVEIELGKGLFRFVISGWVVQYGYDVMSSIHE